MKNDLFIFTLGILVGIVLAPKIAHAFAFIIRAQMKIFARQCRLFYILRVRYKNKEAIKIFQTNGKN